MVVFAHFRVVVSFWVVFELFGVVPPFWVASTCLFLLFYLRLSFILYIDNINNNIQTLTIK